MCRHAGCEHRTQHEIAIEVSSSPQLAHDRPRTVFPEALGEGVVPVVLETLNGVADRCQQLGSCFARREVTGAEPRSPTSKWEEGRLENCER
jgi:hypothetical protein